MSKTLENEGPEENGEPNTAPWAPGDLDEESPEASLIEAEVRRLHAELEEERREKGQFHSLLQRVQADFLNYKRRVEEERQEQERQNSARLLLNLLPVLDDFQRALEHVPANQRSESWLAGVELIQWKLQALLEAEGVSRIEAQGQPFDPALHEALVSQGSDQHREGEIVAVIREGYTLHGKVLRPAQVVVARGRGETVDTEHATPQQDNPEEKEA